MDFVRRRRSIERVGTKLIGYPCILIIGHPSDPLDESKSERESRSKVNEPSQLSGFFLLLRGRGGQGANRFDLSLSQPLRSLDFLTRRRTGLAFIGEPGWRKVDPTPFGPKFKNEDEGEENRERVSLG